VQKCVVWCGGQLEGVCCGALISWLTIFKTIMSVMVSKMFSKRIGQAALRCERPVHHNNDTLSSSITTLPHPLLAVVATSKLVRVDRPETS